MILSLLFACCVAPQSATLQVQGPEGMEWVAQLPPRGARVLLPQTSISDRVPRAWAGRKGLELWLAATGSAPLANASLKVYSAHHERETQLLMFGEELRALSSIQAPKFVHRAGTTSPCLDLLARQDQVGLQNETLRVAAGPEGSDLVLIPMESPGVAWSLEARQANGEWSRLTGSTLAGHALRLDGSSPWDLRLGVDGLDQVFHATSLAFGESEQALEAHGERLFLEAAAETAPRAARGPARKQLLPQGRGQATEGSVEGHALATGSLLRNRYTIPGEPRPDWTTTVLVDVHFDAAEERTAQAIRAAAAPAPFFRDQALEAGIHAVHFEGPAQQLDIRPTMGPGAAWGDVDGDGLMDLYLIQGAGRENSEIQPNRLLRNRGDGRFEPIPGAENTGAGMGALFFDLDGDGDMDLYVANYGADALYRNDGAEGFRDVSAEHDLASDGWSAGVAAADTDGDGDLDLYVTSYLVYDTEQMPPVEDLPGYAREDPVEMLPFAFPAAANHFLENVDGKLVDRTQAMGLADVEGRGMQPVFWDFDMDGDPDLYIPNDVSMNKLYRNEGDGSFKDISFQVGMDDPRGGMGVTTGDVDGDGDSDLFLTNWELEGNALYRNNHISKGGNKSHRGTFQDVTVFSRLARDSVGTTSWGAVLFDADNDGDLDLFIPNGYTSPDYESTGICVGQPNQFFLNDGSGRFKDVSEQAGDAVRTPLASRAAALCDYDGDGRLDLLVTNNNGPYQLLHNELPSAGHWVGLNLRAAKGSAIGAQLKLEVDGQILQRELQAGSGYLAGHAAQVHFGLGEAQGLGQLHVRWPSGQQSVHTLTTLDSWQELHEPAQDTKAQSE